MSKKTVEVELTIKTEITMDSSEPMTDVFDDIVHSLGMHKSSDFDYSVEQARLVCFTLKHGNHK